MRGHAALLDMRANRKRPSIVFVNDYPCATDWAEHGDAATICVDGDQLGVIDLRCLVGLTVSISSPSESRAKALFDLCKASGAAVVAAAHTTDRYSPDSWATVWRKHAAS